MPTFPKVAPYRYIEDKVFLEKFIVFINEYKKQIIGKYKIAVQLIKNLEDVKEKLESDDYLKAKRDCLLKINIISGECKYIYSLIQEGML